LIDEPEAPPPAPKPRATVPVWVPFLALFATLIIVSIFGLAVYGVAAATDPAIHASDDLPVGFTQALTFFQDIVFVFAAWIGVKLALGSVKPADLGLRRVSRIWPAVGWAITGLVAFYIVGAVLAELFGKPDDQTLVDDLKTESALGVLIAWGLLICVFAPIAEEVFFRGFMFTVFSRRMGVAWAALLDGVVFGIGHAGGAEVIQLVALGAFGVALCLLYWRTQSIIPGMALHALNNSITFGATLDLEPALFAGVVVGSVGVVIAGATAVSARSAVAA
jgi:membrane protease YdiL (CAAX protease family)